MIVVLLLAMASVVGCEAAERRSGVDERQCHGELAVRTDVEMAAQWRRTLAKLKRDDVENRRQKLNVPDLAPPLLASQRAWLRYRDAQCAVVSNQAAGGTGYGDMGSLCEIELTRQRIDILRKLETDFLMPKVN
ncbi:lysozyme inhibitor LprI family protein [uncultured Sphingomonas sp.]|uniref:lysozyme inhibitor LprI family protein n=1 Tax=uncultured Sphingomonas sp. TaxID=158754 RepID=UPI0035CAA5D7